MEEERFNKLKEIAPRSGAMGVYDGRRNEEKTMYARAMIPKESDEAKKLEEEGYILVYPKLPERRQDDATAKYICNNDVMILDKSNVTPGYNLLNDINHFYNRYSPENINDLTFAENATTRRFRASDEVKEIYNKIGAEYEEVGNDVRVTDETLYTLKRGKIANFYEKAKGKVKNTFNKMKSFFKGKENEKNIENSDNERE